MGMGDFDGGEGPAGEDPVVSSAPEDPTVPATALQVDGIAGDFILDENGRYVTAHWVDAAAFNLLRVAAGVIRSAPAFGETISALKYIDKRKIESQVNDRVRIAWSDLLSRGLVSILGIEIDTSVRTRVMYRVSYVNNVTKTRQSASSQA